MTTSYQGILFDLDGTLLDTAPDFITALNKLLIEQKRDALAPEVIRAGVTNGSVGLVTMAFGLSPEDREFEAIRLAFLEHYFQSLSENTRLFPGMETVLSRLADSNIPWGIVTNKPERFTTAILDMLSLPYPPGTVICPDHVQQTKPHPEGILKACSQIGIEPAGSLYIGDHLRDIQAGHNAGTRTASAAYGYIDNTEIPENWGADYLIHSADELIGIIFHP